MLMQRSSIVCHPVAARQRTFAANNHCSRRVHTSRAGRKVLRVHAHASPVSSSATELKKTGFVGEMRAVAMKLHTREQAPKEGGVEAPKRTQAWAPTLWGYQQFLAESKVVYNAFEDIMHQASDAWHPEYSNFQHTGLERSAGLAADLEYMQQQHKLPPPVIQEDGPGMTYAKHLKQLAADDPQSFICHYYNYYFAHTAGGRMIGKKVSDMLLGGKELAFYEYKDDVNTLLDNVRSNLNTLAEGWSKEQKEHCLKETADAFQWSGGLMKCMTEEQPAQAA